MFAHLLEIQSRLGKDKFPLIDQTYHPNSKEMVSWAFMVIKFLVIKFLNPLNLNLYYLQPPLIYLDLPAIPTYIA